jgi:hypothetical protein
VAPRGPVPLYCSPAHKQAAYGKRRRAEASKRGDDGRGLSIERRVPRAPKKSRPKTINCAWCGKTVAVGRKGPIPLYCSRAHSQLAYMKRRTDRIADALGRTEASWQAALEAAAAERQALVGALMFYADRANYVVIAEPGPWSLQRSEPAVMRDAGRRASEALDQAPGR